MKIIERCPRTEVHAEVALLEVIPNTFTIRHAANIALTPVRMVLHVGIGTELQFADHVFHAVVTLLIACGGIHGHRRQVVTTHMTVQSVPVRIGLGTRLQSRFLAVGCQQTVTVVLQQCPYVQVSRFLQRTIQESDVPKGKFITIQFLLRVASHRHNRYQHRCQYFFHIPKFRSTLV